MSRLLELLAAAAALWVASWLVLIVLARRRRRGCCAPSPRSCRPGVVLLLRYAARSVPRDVLLAAWPAEPALLLRLLGEPGPRR